MNFSIIVRGRYTFMGFIGMALKLHFIFWDYDEFSFKKWGDVAWMGGFLG